MKCVKNQMLVIFYNDQVLFHIYMYYHPPLTQSGTSCCAAQLQWVGGRHHIHEVHHYQTHQVRRYSILTVALRTTKVRCFILFSLVAKLDIPIIKTRLNLKPDKSSTEFFFTDKTPLQLDQEIQECVFSLL